MQRGVAGPVVVDERFGCSATDLIDPQAVRGGCMRRSLVDPTLARLPLFESCNTSVVGAASRGSVTINPRQDKLGKLMDRDVRAHLARDFA